MKCAEDVTPVAFKVRAGSPPCPQRDAACSNARFDGTCIPDVAKMTGGVLRFFPPAARLLKASRSKEPVEIETVCVGRRAYVLALAALRAGDAASYETRLRAAAPVGSTLSSILATLKASKLPREDAWCLWHDGTVYFAVDAGVPKVGRLNGILAKLLPNSLAAVIRSKGGALTSAALTILATRLGVALISSTLVAVASHAVTAFWELLRKSGLVAPSLMDAVGEGSSLKQTFDMIAQMTLGISTDLRSTMTQLMMQVMLPGVVASIAYSLDFARGVTEQRRWSLAEAVLVVARENLHPGSAKTLPVAFLNGVSHLADRQSRTMLAALGLHGVPPRGAADQTIVKELQNLRDAPSLGGDDLFTQVTSGIAHAIPGLLSRMLGTSGALALTLNTVTAVPVLLYDVWNQARQATTPEVILAKAAATPQREVDALEVRRAALLARAELRVALAQHLAATGKTEAAASLPAIIGCEYAEAVQRLQGALGVESEEDDEDWGLGLEEEDAASEAQAKAKRLEAGQAAEAKAEALLAEFGHTGMAANEWPTYAHVELASKLLRTRR